MYRTIAVLDRDDPLREVAMNASFLRASLFTSVTARTIGLGAVSLTVGAGMTSPARRQ